MAPNDPFHHLRHLFEGRKNSYLLDKKAILGKIRRFDELGKRAIELKGFSQSKTAVNPGRYQLHAREVLDEAQNTLSEMKQLFHDEVEKLHELFVAPDIEELLPHPDDNASGDRRKQSQKEISPLVSLTRRKIEFMDEKEDTLRALFTRFEAFHDEILFNLCMMSKHTYLQKHLPPLFENISETVKEIEQLADQLFSELEQRVTRQGPESDPPQPRSR